MDTRASRKTLEGTTPEEKLGSIGIAIGGEVDVRTLGAIANTYNVGITLFFEPDLARNRTLASVRDEYGATPEYERPYIDVNSFLRFTRENDPSFEQTLQEFPLMIEIVSVGQEPAGNSGNPALFVTGLMPFLDELDVDSPVPEPGMHIPR